MTVMLGVVLAVVLLGPMISVVDGTAGTQPVTNESVTATTGEYVELEGYDLVGSSVVVFGYNDTSGSFEQASEGTDYEIDLQSGELQALSGSSLIDDGEEVKVTYDYESTSGTVTTVLNLLPLLVGTLILGSVGAYLQSEL